MTEEDLLARVEVDYVTGFTNIWNPTIAKLASEYGVQTKMYALWPLFKPELFKRALQEYNTNPATMNIQAYENPNDSSVFDEPLPLAYKEMFEAVKLGCSVVYGRMTKARLIRALDAGRLVQTSIRTQVLYPSARPSYHSLLIYKRYNNVITYHDPARSAGMECDINNLLRAANDTGAYMEYKV